VPQLRLRPLPLALALLLTPLARAADGPDWALCRAPEALPALRSSPAASDAPRTGANTLIEADRLDVSEAGSTVFQGQVELQRADQWLRSEELRYQHDDGRWASPGPPRRMKPRWPMCSTSSTAPKPAMAVPPR
jgi:LPS-assembly protein